MLEIQVEKQERGAFWAMNLTMALSNLETIVRRAFATVGKTTATDDRAKLQKALEELRAEKAIYQPKIERVFFRSLPSLYKFRQFIEMGGEKSTPPQRSSRQASSTSSTSAGRDFTSSDLYDLLSFYVDALHELRNYFAHSEHAYPNWPQRLKIQGVPSPSSFENALFNANIRIVKERFYKDPNTSQDKIEAGFISLRPKLVKNKQTIDNPNFKFRLNEKNADGRHYPTQAGLAFFIARFLEKRYVDLLFESTNATGAPTLQLFRPQDFNGFEFSLAPRRVYGVNAARLPRRRVETSARPESSNETLGLDLIGYLARCPRIVYDLLSPGDRRAFRVAADESNPSEGLRTRSEKRFPHLAALCLDRMEAFSRLRFQVDMGQYFSAPHRRRLLDGATIDDRRVGKRLFWFERIQNAVAYYRAERMKPESKYFVPTDAGATPPDSDYQIDAYPKYRVKNQQLGLRLVGPNNAPPELIPWTHSATRGSKKTRNQRPEFWLSQYELPALLFVALNGKAQDAQDVIADYQTNWRRFLTDVRDGKFDFDAGRAFQAKRQAFEEEYRLRFDDLPDSIRALFRSGAAPDKPLPQNAQTSDPASDPLEAQVRRLIDETQRRIDELRSEAQETFKLGQRKRPSLTVGRVAAWLVRDMMRFQYATKEKAFGKIPSSPDFIALQTALASFDSRRSELLELFKAAKLIPMKFVAPRDSDEAFYFANCQHSERSSHPFLGGVVACRANLSSWKSFYRAYLENRLKWLRQCETHELYAARWNLRRSSKREKMRRANKRQSVAQELAGRLLEQPINLPRGLFTDLVRSVVKERFGARYDEATNGGTKSTNASWLIGKARDWSGDASPGFYAWPRDYRNAGGFKRLFDLCAVSPKEAKTITLQELKKRFDQHYDNLYRFIFKDDGGGKLKARRRETEHAKIRRLSDLQRDIRHSEIQDYVLALAASYLLFEGDLSQIRLADAHAIVDDATGQTASNPLRKLRSYAVSVDVPPRGVCVIRGEMNVKNHGNFQRFLTDVRLPSFLSSLSLMGAENAESLSYVDLANEFAASDRTERGRVLDAIYRFERACFQRFPDLTSKAKNGYVSFMTILNTAFPDDEETQYRLLVIRNKFMHNEYPIFTTQRSQDAERWEPIFTRWNREMWAAYDPRHGRALCRCIADWALPYFEEATRSLR